MFVYLFGVIHDSSLHWPSFNSSLFWSYLLLGAILLLASRFPVVREGEDEPVIGDTEQAASSGVERYP